MPTTFSLTFARFDENYLRKNENIIKFDLWWFTALEWFAQISKHTKIFEIRILGFAGFS